MTAVTAARPRRGLTARTKRIITAAVVVVVLVAMALSTKFVPAGSKLAEQQKAFSASRYGKEQFPKIQKYVTKNAVEATTLATALQADPTAAAKKYGVPTEGGVGTEIPVSFTGVVGQVPKSGYTPVTIPGLPQGVAVGVQLGPAINGTDLRDADGKVTLGDFENQIQFQDAASGINDQLKVVLKKAGAPNLQGKTITVDGVLNLVNPAQWNITPATFKVGG